MTGLTGAVRLDRYLTALTTDVTMSVAVSARYYITAVGPSPRRSSCSDPLSPPAPQDALAPPRDLVRSGRIRLY